MQIEFLTSLPTIRFLEAKQDHQGLLVTAVGLGSTTCPDCGTPSTSRKGYYVRRLQDLPVQGRPVRVQVQVGRWRCRNILCARRSFAERLDSAALCYARRTRRLTELVCVLGHAAGGLPAERLLKRLGMPHSDDTVLRSVKRQAANRSAKVRVAGIDDWSQQRQGRSYGTIVVDLECRQVVEVLGDRSAESTAQWLRKHPEVEIVSRDRCGLYAQGARQGAPQAEQIADRFHLLQNLRETLERQLGRCHPHTAIASPMPSPQAQTLCWEARNGVSGCGLESEAQKHLLLNRQSRRAWWLERFERVKTLQGERKTLEEICQETRLNWRTVAKWTKLKELPQRRTMNPKSTTPMRYSGYLARRWVEGIRSARHLLAEIRKLGYTGSLTHLDRLLSQWRRTGPRPTTFAGDDGGGHYWLTPRFIPLRIPFSV